MKEMMISLMYWISSLTGYSVHVPPPDIYFMSAREVAATCIDEGTLVPYVAQSCYKLHKHAIYMRDDFQVGDPAKVGVMVHELTHVLQLSNGQEYNLATMDHYEGEADRIEEIYENAPNVQEQLQAYFVQMPGARIAVVARDQLQNAAPGVSPNAADAHTFTAMYAPREPSSPAGTPTKMAADPTGRPIGQVSLSQKNLDDLRNQVNALREDKHLLEKRLAEFETKLDLLIADRISDKLPEEKPGPSAQSPAADQAPGSGPDQAAMAPSRSAPPNQASPQVDSEASPPGAGQSFM